jgi:hypothetical protein
MNSSQGWILIALLLAGVTFLQETNKLLSTIAKTLRSEKSFPLHQSVDLLRSALEKQRAE